MRRYRIEIEYDGPDEEANFSPVVLERHVQKVILETLNQMDTFRKQKLENLYNLKSIGTVVLG